MSDTTDMTASEEPLAPVSIPASAGEALWWGGGIGGDQGDRCGYGRADGDHRDHRAARCGGASSRPPQRGRGILGSVTPAGFEELVRAMSVPANARTLPPGPQEPPNPEALGELFAKHGCEIVDD